MVKPERLMLGATIVFIAGLITSSIAIKAYQTLIQVQKSSGITINEENARRVITILSLLPWIFGALYSAIIVYVIYYVLQSEKKGEYF